jgi:hypothetical protein
MHLFVFHDLTLMRQVPRYAGHGLREIPRSLVPSPQEWQQVPRCAGRCLRQVPLGAVDDIRVVHVGDERRPARSLRPRRTHAQARQVLFLPQQDHGHLQGAFCRFSFQYISILIKFYVGKFFGSFLNQCRL